MADTPTSAQIVANALASTKGDATFLHTCLGYVARMMGLPASGTPNPKTAYHAWQVSPYKHAGDTRPPQGALVYWGPRIGGGAGHVAISLGNGDMVSTHSKGGKPAVYRIGSLSPENYLGWTAPALAGTSQRVAGGFSASAPTKGGGNASGQSPLEQLGDNLYPDNVPNPLAGAYSSASSAVSLTGWIKDNLARIGIASLAVLIIIIAIIYQNKGTIKETVQTVAKVAPVAV